MNNKVPIKVVTAILFILCIAAVSEGIERNGAYYTLSAPSVSPRRLEKEIHALINQERKKRGLHVLAWNADLNRIARKFSKEMARQDFFAHEDPKGKTFHDRYVDGGFYCRICVDNDTVCLGAENLSQDNVVSSLLYEHGKVFMHYNTEDEIARSVVERWMSSKGHRRNILMPYFTREGIGVAISDSGKVYVTEDFC